jgi:hypothetical protein
MWSIVDQVLNLATEIVGLASALAAYAAYKKTFQSAANCMLLGS